MYLKSYIGDNKIDLEGSKSLILLNTLLLKKLDISNGSFIQLLVARQAVKIHVSKVF